MTQVSKKGAEYLGIPRNTPESLGKRARNTLTRWAEFLPKRYTTSEEYLWNPLFVPRRAHIRQNKSVYIPERRITFGNTPPPPRRMSSSRRSGMTCVTFPYGKRNNFEPLGHVRRHFSIRKNKQFKHKQFFTIKFCTHTGQTYLIWKYGRRPAESPRRAARAGHASSQQHHTRH